MTPAGIEADINRKKISKKMNREQAIDFLIGKAEKEIRNCEARAKLLEEKTNKTQDNHNSITFERKAIERNRLRLALLREARR